MQKTFIDIFSNLTVLIAEDNKSQREKLKEIISLFTDKVLTAADGQEAYELYRLHSANLIITDIKMPRMDGIELVRKIREIDKKVPVIVLSAHTEKHLLLKAVSLRLNNYIEKPITQDDLINSLNDAINFIIKESLLEIKLSNGCIYKIIEETIYNDKEEIRLTKKEKLFLNLLIKNINQVISKKEIENLLWTDSVMTSAALKNFIFKLRKKIGHDTLLTSSTNGFLIQL